MSLPCWLHPLADSSSSFQPLKGEMPLLKHYLFSITLTLSQGNFITKMVLNTIFKLVHLFNKSTNNLIVFYSTHCSARMMTH